MYYLLIFETWEKNHYEFIDKSPEVIYGESKLIAHQNSDGLKL